MFKKLCSLILVASILMSSTELTPHARNISKTEVIVRCAAAATVIGLIATIGAISYIKSKDIPNGCMENLAQALNSCVTL